MWRRPRAPAMNQLRGRSPGAGVTGRLLRGGGARGASTVAISRLAEHFWHSWDPQEFAFWSQGGTIGTLQQGAVLGTGRAGPVGREVGEAWKGKAAPREYHPATLQRTGEEPGPRALGQVARGHL